MRTSTMLTLDRRERSRGNERWQARQGPGMPGNAATYGMLLTAKAAQPWFVPLIPFPASCSRTCHTWVQTTPMSVSPGVPEGFTSSACYR
jgi:hypothetical protein